MFIDFRYDRMTEELICDELGVAYKINKGIPNLIPQDAKKIDTDCSSTKS